MAQETNCFTLLKLGAAEFLCCRITSCNDYNDHSNCMLPPTEHYLPMSHKGNTWKDYHRSANWIKRFWKKNKIPPSDPYTYKACVKNCWKWVYQTIDIIVAYMNWVFINVGWYKHHRFLIEILSFSLIQDGHVCCEIYTSLYVQNQGVK